MLKSVACHKILNDYFLGSFDFFARARSCAAFTRSALAFISASLLGLVLDEDLAFSLAVLDLRSAFVLGDLAPCSAATFG